MVPTGKEAGPARGPTVATGTQAAVVVPGRIGVHKSSVGDAVGEDVGELVVGLVVGLEVVGRDVVGLCVGHYVSQSQAVMHNCNTHRKKAVSANATPL